uniref:F-box domain-containing protein n=1 Tax=Rhabditophanes sp. KR3021 TaxID=114890 RepID=A0AC35UHP1_9BILA
MQMIVATHKTPSFCEELNRPPPNEFLRRYQELSLLEKVFGNGLIAKSIFGNFKEPLHLVDALNCNRVFYNAIDGLGIKWNGWNKRHLSMKFNLMWGQDDSIRAYDSVASEWNDFANGPVYIDQMKKNVSNDYVKELQICIRSAIDLKEDGSQCLWINDFVGCFKNTETLQLNMDFDPYDVIHSIKSDNIKCVKNFDWEMVILLLADRLDSKMTIFEGLRNLHKFGINISFGQIFMATSKDTIKKFVDLFKNDIVFSITVSCVFVGQLMDSDNWKTLIKCLNERGVTVSLNVFNDPTPPIITNHIQITKAETLSIDTKHLDDGSFMKLMDGNYGDLKTLNIKLKDSWMCPQFQRLPSLCRNVKNFNKLEEFSFHFHFLHLRHTSNDQKDDEATKSILDLTAMLPPTLKTLSFKTCPANLNHWSEQTAKQFPELENLIFYQSHIFGPENHTNIVATKSMNKQEDVTAFKHFKNLKVLWHTHTTLKMEYPESLKVLVIYNVNGTQEGETTFQCKKNPNLASLTKLEHTFTHLVHVPYGRINQMTNYLNVYLKVASDFEIFEQRWLKLTELEGLF